MQTLSPKSLPSKSSCVTLHKSLNFSASISEKTSISFPYKIKRIIVPISKVVGRIELVNICKALRTILGK